MKRFAIRFVSFLLAIVMLSPAVALPTNAQVHVQTYLSDDQYKRDGISADIYDLESVQKNCYGFTLIFEVFAENAELRGDYNYEVCVHDTAGNWIVADMFRLNEGYKKLHVDVSWKDPHNVDKIAIIPRKKNLKISYRVHFTDPQDQPGFAPWGIEYTYSENKFRKFIKWTYPIVLNETLTNCQGFTLHYVIDEVQKGTLTADMRYEIYARASGGTWKKLDSFKLYGDEAIVDVKIKNKMDIDEIAVLRMSNKSCSYVHNIAVTDAICDQPPVQEQPVPEYVPSVYLPGYWSDSLFTRSGRQSSPFVLNEPMKKCKAFTLDYEVTEVTEGKMKDDSRFVVYYQTYNGEWNRGEEFTLDEGFASVYVKLPKAATVNQVAVHCMNAGQFSYNFTMGIRNPEY